MITKPGYAALARSTSCSTRRRYAECSSFFFKKGKKTSALQSPFSGESSYFDNFSTKNNLKTINFLIEKNKFVPVCACRGEVRPLTPPPRCLLFAGTAYNVCVCVCVCVCIPH
jgi:hypothetical protein